MAASSAVLKGGNPQIVNKVAVLDYLYKRCDELGGLIGSTRGTEREEAKKERVFLQGQLKIVCLCRGVRQVEGTTRVE